MLARGWVLGLSFGLAGAWVDFAEAQTSAPPAAVPPGPPGGPAPAAAATGGEAQKPRFVVRADKGFLDDPFSLDERASELVVLRTDSASFARLDVLDLGSGKLKKQLPLGDAAPTFERVLFVPGGKGFVVIMRDPAKGLRSAQLLAPDGKAAGLVGPATDFGVTKRNGAPVLVGWNKSQTTSGDTNYVVAGYKLDGLTSLGKPATLTVSRTSEIKNLPLKLLGWQAGYGHIIGVTPGGFDKQKDMRQPDRAAVYDVLGKVFTYQGEIRDVMAWAAVNNLRSKHPGRALIGLMADDQKSIHVIDFLGRLARLEVPVPMKLYDPTSFRSEEDLDRGVLHFSLGVDPLNPDALARQKKERAYLDLYEAAPVDARGAGNAPSKDPPRYRVKRLLRAALDDRPVAWVVVGNHVAILRKHKSFSRGGNELEVYGLTPAK